MQIFGYPQVGRAGLGNLLYPWARCYLWTHKYRIPMIAPNWPFIQLGAYIRRERDKRNYHRLFRSDGYVSGARKLYWLTTYRRISEQDLAGFDLNVISDRSIVVFEGMTNQFEPLLGHHEIIGRELRRITRRTYRPIVPNRPYIGVHVRRGDFTVDCQKLNEGADNVQIPIDWYVTTLTKIRNSLGLNLPALVFSDGSNSELVDLLKLENVHRFGGCTAITDLLALSRSSLLIASASNFSAWASFLGQLPTVYYPGQLKAQIHDRLESAIEVGYQDALPQTFENIAQASCNTCSTESILWT